MGYPNNLKQPFCGLTHLLVMSTSIAEMLGTSRASPHFHRLVATRSWLKMISATVVLEFERIWNQNPCPVSHCREYSEYLTTKKRHVGFKQVRSGLLTWKWQIHENFCSTCYGDFRANEVSQKSLHHNLTKRTSSYTSMPSRSHTPRTPRHHLKFLVFPVHRKRLTFFGD